MQFNEKECRNKWYCNSPKVSIYSLPVDMEKCFGPTKQKGE